MSEEKRKRPINREALTAVADMLDTKKRERAFNMQQWGEDNPTPECGFAACAMGWAVTHGIVQGLELRRATIRPGRFYIAHGDRLTQFDAVGTVMGLTPAETDKLFGPYSYNDPHDPAPVAARIREFLETHKDD